MKKLGLAIALCVALFSLGCLGPNRLHDSIRNWNAEVTDQDWLTEVIFLGLTIIPVYGFAYLGDILVVNTIDYWSGTNPISDPGPFPESKFTSGD